MHGVVGALARLGAEELPRWQRFQIARADVAQAPHVVLALAAVAQQHRAVAKLVADEKVWLEAQVARAVVGRGGGGRGRGRVGVGRCGLDGAVVSGAS